MCGIHGWELLKEFSTAQFTHLLNISLLCRDSLTADADLIVLQRFIVFSVYR